jgi:hypothetical protein
LCPASAQKDFTSIGAKAVAGPVKKPYDQEMRIIVLFVFWQVIRIKVIRSVLGIKVILAADESISSWVGSKVYPRDLGVFILQEVKAINYCLI